MPPYQKSQRELNEQTDYFSNRKGQSADPVARRFQPGRISDLTLIHFDHGDAIAPSDIAARVLRHFYQQVALAAQGPWADTRPRIWVKITLGSIELLLMATHGHTVPWNFVSWVALFMLQYVRGGYVGTYDSYWVTPDGEAGVIVSLSCQAIGALASAATIAAAAAAAEANGGGEVLNGNARPLNPNATPFNPS